MANMKHDEELHRVIRERDMYGYEKVIIGVGRSMASYLYRTRRPQTEQKRDTFVTSNKHSGHIYS